MKFANEGPNELPFARHLIVKSEEHLRYEKDQPKSEIKIPLEGCLVCRNSTTNNFEIIKKCMSNHEAKINETFFIKKKILN